MTLKQTLKQIGKFLIGGGVGGSLHYAIFFSLDYLGIYYQTANVLGFLVGVSVNFFIQKHWTFNNKDKKSKQQFILYFLLKIIILGVHAGFLYICIDIEKTTHFFGQLIATSVVTVVSFVLTKMLFAKKDPEK